MRKVVKIPQSMKRANISITWLSHGEVFVFVTVPLVLRGPNTVCATMAPTFPAAAERPWEVER